MFFLSRGQRRRCVGSAWLNHSCLCFCPPQILIAIVLYIFLLMYASCIRLRRLVEHSTLREFLNSMQRSRLESEILFFTFFSPHANNYFISIPCLWSFRFFMLSFHRCFAISDNTQPSKTVYSDRLFCNRIFNFVIHTKCIFAQFLIPFCVCRTAIFYLWLFFPISSLSLTLSRSTPKQIVPARIRHWNFAVCI